jgi:hypothetical protein
MDKNLEVNSNNEKYQLVMICTQIKQVTAAVEVSET